VSRRYKCIDCEEWCFTTAGRCRSCKSKHNEQARLDNRRNWFLNKKYGITLEDFEGYWYAQQGKCCICRIRMRRPTMTRGQALDVVAVDHCHKTGKFRALLCNKCNKGLGHFNDDLQILQNAIRYLNGHNEKASLRAEDCGN
jgi:hypothetical protein